MNDFEHQLSQQPLRTPPPEWRAEILVAAAKISTPDWTWRDWMWPSPKAWGALAAVWVFALIVDTPPSRSAASPALAAPRTADAPPLYAFALGRDFDALLQTLAL